MTDGARIIWVLFGDLKFQDGKEVDETAFVNELRGIYRRYKGRAESKGLALGMQRDKTSKKAFLQLVAEPATVAIAWHSHGDAATGEIVAGCNTDISPRDITGVSSRLQFVALLGCVGTSGNRERWIKAFRLNRFGDAKRRLTTYPDTEGTTRRDDLVKFANGSHSWKRLFGFPTFPQWLDELKPEV